MSTRIFGVVVDLLGERKFSDWLKYSSRLPIVPIASNTSHNVDFSHYCDPYHTYNSDEIQAFNRAAGCASDVAFQRNWANSIVGFQETMMLQYPHYRMSTKVWRLWFIEGLFSA